MLVRVLKWKEIYNKKIILWIRNNLKLENKFRLLIKLYFNIKKN